MPNDENGMGSGEGCPLPSRLGDLGEGRKKSKTGFGAFRAIKARVLTRKFSIFDIFAICGG